MADINGLGDQIAQLTLAQAVELKNYLKEKYQIEPSGGGVMIAPQQSGPAAPAAPAAEPTEFNVVLEAGFDATKKIGIIKVVREITGQGLAEAKATVEGAPKNLKEGIEKKAAEDLKKKLEDAGAKVTVKPA